MHETCWKGEKARCIDGGYKMWYCRSGSKKNGVGIILKRNMWRGQWNCGGNRQDNMLEDGT